VRILLDESLLPRPLGRALVGHDFSTVRDEGWTSLANGALLQQAAERFDAVLTADQNIQFQTPGVQLTEAKAAFRALKSELAIRPVFHQLERRVKAHLLVAFLGYALWVTLKQLLRRRGTGLTPAQALAHLATLQSADIVLPTTDGREIRLRRVTEPTPEQQRLLAQLEIPIPTHLERNTECSADFVTS